MTQISPLSPERWIEDLFSSNVALKGRVIRRKKRDVIRFAGLERFLAEVDRRGFLAIENAGQIVVFCNDEPVKRLSTLRLQRQHERAFAEQSYRRDFDVARQAGLD